MLLNNAIIIPDEKCTSLSVLWKFTPETIYFRQMSTQEEDGETAVKLPVKWMALESLNDGVFSEKTDVVGTPTVLVNTLCEHEVTVWFVSCLTA